MIYKKINDNCIFFSSEELELIFAAANLLQGEVAHQLCTELYGLDEINRLKRKYCFLFEVCISLKEAQGTGLFEHLLSYNLDQFNLINFKEYLLSMDLVEFITIYLDQFEESLIVKACESDRGLEEFYFNNQEKFGSLLGLQSFFRETKRFIKEYFALAEELRTDSFLQAMTAMEVELKNQEERCRIGLSQVEPIEFADKIMGKTCYHRGPFETHTFLPSLLLPYRYIRLIGKSQILCYSIRQNKLDNETILAQLKTIADSTRLKIISLLNNKEPLRGLDIATELSLAPSTVSHHMEQLRKAGLVNEEQDKNSKYYSVSRNSVNELLELLKETLSE